MYSSVDSNKDASERNYLVSGFATLQLTVDSLLVAFASLHSTNPTTQDCPFNLSSSVFPNIEVTLKLKTF